MGSLLQLAIPGLFRYQRSSLHDGYHNRMINGMLSLSCRSKWHSDFSPHIFQRLERPKKNYGILRVHTHCEVGPLGQHLEDTFPPPCIHRWPIWIANYSKMTCTNLSLIRFKSSFVYLWVIGFPALSNPIQCSQHASIHAHLRPVR